MASDPQLADIPVIVVSAKADDQAMAQLSGPIIISRRDGFRLGELTRALEAIFWALAPGWHVTGSMESVP